MALKLTRDTIRCFVSFLDPLSLFAASRVTKSFSRAINDDGLIWKDLLKRIHAIVEAKVSFHRVFECFSCASLVFLRICSQLAPVNVGLSACSLDLRGCTRKATGCIDKRRSNELCAIKGSLCIGEGCCGGQTPK